jgi:hypothetical protein
MHAIQRILSSILSSNLLNDAMNCVIYDAVNDAMNCAVNDAMNDVPSKKHNKCGCIQSYPTTTTQCCIICTLLLDIEDVFL